MAFGGNDVDVKIGVNDTEFQAGMTRMDARTARSAQSALALQRAYVQVANAVVSMVGSFASMQISQKIAEAQNIKDEGQRKRVIADLQKQQALIQALNVVHQALNATIGVAIALRRAEIATSRAGAIAEGTRAAAGTAAAVATTGGAAAAYLPALVIGAFTAILAAVAFLQEGGITTRAGLAFLHPQEAVIPLNRGLPGGLGGGTVIININAPVRQPELDRLSDIARRDFLAVGGRLR